MTPFSYYVQTQSTQTESAEKRTFTDLSPPPHTPFLHLKDNLEFRALLLRHRSGEEQREHMQICSTNRMLWMHQETCRISAALMDSAMCCHLRSAPKLRGVQPARAEAENPVHVQSVRVQMLYVHMLSERGHFWTLKVM